MANRHLAGIVLNPAVKDIAQELSPFGSGNGIRLQFSPVIEFNAGNILMMQLFIGNQIVEDAVSGIDIGLADQHQAVEFNVVALQELNSDRKSVV